MAGSRLDKIGNIFSRATGLLRSGAIKYDDRPIWYDIYRVFPPKYEPRYNREIDLTQFEVKPIFYEEDLVRADFFKRFGRNPGGIVRNLKAHSVEDDCQRFINEYNTAKKENPSLSHEELFESVAKSFAITLHRPARRIREPSERQGVRASSTGLSEQDDDLMDHDEDFETSRLAASKRGRKSNIITASTLLSMFKEAREDAEAETSKDSSSTKKKPDEESKPK